MFRSSSIEAVTGIGDPKEILSIQMYLTSRLSFIYFAVFMIYLDFLNKIQLDQVIPGNRRMLIKIY